MNKIILLTFFVITLHGHAELQYSFETGTDGWVSILESTDPAMAFSRRTASSLLRLSSYGISVSDGNSPHRNDAQNCGLLFRSPEFKFVDLESASLSFQLGSGSEDNAQAPSYDSDSVLTNSSSSDGYTGLLLRNVDSGAYIIASENDSPADDPAGTITWSHSDLSGLINVQDRYTLDLVDLKEGPWGWVSLDNVSISGAAAFPENSPFNITSISVHQTSGVGFDHVALGTNITPHSNIVLGDPLNVIDGDFGTVWYSHQGSINEISFTLDLEQDVVIGRLVHYPTQTAYYLIETSSDGASWTNRHSAIMDSYDDAGILTQDVMGAYSARFIRYTAQNNRSAYIGVSEFQVFEMEYPHIEVSFPSLTNGYYTLQSNEDLSSENWTNVEGQVDVPGNGGTVTLQDANLYSNQFYRVQESDKP